MKDLNRRLFYHLDDLREDAGISIIEFCEGICDRRQYTRYKNGIHEVSLKNISRFYRKLGLAEIEFYNSFYFSDLSEYPRLNKLYFCLINRELKEARKYINELREIEFVGVRTKRYFQFEIIYYDYLDKQVSHAHTLELLKRLINYDNCINKKYFDFIDIASLRLIMITEMKAGLRKTLDVLKRLIMEEKFIYITSETRNIMPSIYVSVVRELGMERRYDEALEVCKKALQYSIGIRSTHLLEDIYYYLFLIYKNRRQEDTAYVYARKAIEVLDVTDNYAKLQKVKSLIDNDLEFDSVELFRNIEFDKNGT